MKKYVKPTIELVELKTEERLAASGCAMNFNGGSIPVCSIPNAGLQHISGNPHNR